MELKDIPKGNYGKSVWYTEDRGTVEMDFANPETRLDDMTNLFRRFSGSQFAIPMLAKRYGVSTRKVQQDLSHLEYEQKVIERLNVTNFRGKSEPNKINYVGKDKLTEPLPLPKFKHLNRTI